MEEEDIEIVKNIKRQELVEHSNEKLKEKKDPLTEPEVQVLEVVMKNDNIVNQENKESLENIENIKSQENKENQEKTGNPENLENQKNMTVTDRVMESEVQEEATLEVDTETKGKTTDLLVVTMEMFINLPKIEKTTITIVQEVEIVAIEVKEVQCAVELREDTVTMISIKDQKKVTLLLEKSPANTVENNMTNHMNTENLESTEITESTEAEDEVVMMPVITIREVATVVEAVIMENIVVAANIEAEEVANIEAEVAANLEVVAAGINSTTMDIKIIMEDKEIMISHTKIVEEGTETTINKKTRTLTITNKMKPHLWWCLLVPSVDVVVVILNLLLLISLFKMI